jgi:hypothetical protein
MEDWGKFRRDKLVFKCVPFAECKVRTFSLTFSSFKKVLSKYLTEAKISFREHRVVLLQGGYE